MGKMYFEFNFKINSLINRAAREGRQGQESSTVLRHADEAVADACTTTPSLLSSGAKKLFDS